MPGMREGFWRRPQKAVEPGQQIRALVEAFVAGEPWERFLPPHGTAMDPAFARRWPPNEAVVAMKTSKTRTLGFFTPQGAFLALCCGLADEWHANEDQIYDEKIAKVARVLTSIDPNDIDGTTDVQAIVR